MGNTRNLIFGIVRLSLVIILLGLMVGGVTPGTFSSHSVLADDDEGDDDEGGGNESNGNGDENGKKDKKEKKDKDKEGEDDDDQDRGRGNDDDDEGIVIVAPDVTPIPAPVTPAPTVSPEVEENGTLRIVVKTCSIRPAADADWETACTLPVKDATFKIEAREGRFAGWYRDVEANDAGAASVEDLPVGRYALEQSRDDWCRAESDRVDANGDLVIERGQVTTVWIFNCADPPAGS